MELTIGIPVYKNVETLKKAIDSVLGQENKEISCKIIISEDFSTEEIHNEILSLLKNYQKEKIEYHFNRPALGMTGNWNYCIQLASTEYVALLHDDDFLYKNYFDEVSKVIKGNLKFDVLFWNSDEWVNGVRIENTLNGIKKMYSNLKKNKMKKYKSADYYLGGMEGKTLPTCGTLYKRDEFVEYKPEFGYSTDEIYAEQLCQSKNIYFLNKTVAAHTYRKDTNLSSLKKVKRSFVLEREKHREEMSSKHWMFRFCEKYLHEGMKLDSMYPWQSSLFPEFHITKRIMFEKKLFSLIKRIYIYAQVFSYKDI